MTKHVTAQPHPCRTKALENEQGLMGGGRADGASEQEQVGGDQSIASAAAKRKNSDMHGPTRRRN